jgi:acyl-CoA thioester hydrolase
MPRIRLSVEEVEQLPRTHSATIPTDYLDDMGHMNVMWYTHLFSMAMGGMFGMVGLAWDKLAEVNGGTFALESHVHYLSEVRVGQAIDVHSRLVARTAKRFHSIHFMVNQDKGDVSATFETVGAYMNLAERRMAPLPELIAARIDEVIAEHELLSWPPPLIGTMGA